MDHTMVVQQTVQSMIHGQNAPQAYPWVMKCTIGVGVQIFHGLWSVQQTKKYELSMNDEVYNKGGVWGVHESWIVQ
jgi:hypothetical protein